MAEQGAAPDINEPVTESSLSSSVQEMGQNENELVVTNTDEGNTVAGKLIQDFRNSVKVFTKQALDFTEQLEKCLSFSKTNQREISDLQEEFKHHVKKFEKHCEEAPVASELSCLSEENEKLKKQMEALREENDQKWKEYDQKLKDLAEKLPSSEVPAVTKTAENEVPADAATGSVMEPPLPVISDLLSKLDNLASQMIPKEATNKRRSILETHNIEVRTTYAMDSFDDSDSPQLPRTSSASTCSSGIGSSTGPPTLSRDDSSKLFNIGEDDDTTPAADESLPPEVKLRPKTSTPAIRRGKSMTEKEHNYLEVIWAMDDLANALEKLTEQ